MLFIDRTNHRTVDHHGQLHLTVTRGQSGLIFEPPAVLPPEPAQVITPTDEEERDGETSDRDDE